MFRLLTFVLPMLVVVAFPAAGGGLDQSQYECDQMTAKRDGIWCAVRRIDGMGETLLIRIHRKSTDPAEERRRTKYLVGRTIQNFLARGGIWITMRTTDRAGRVLERACSKVKGRMAEHCGTWRPVGPSESW